MDEYRDPILEQPVTDRAAQHKAMHFDMVAPFPVVSAQLGNQYLRTANLKRVIDMGDR
jgi:hypothetical protein